MRGRIGHLGLVGVLAACVAIGAVGRGNVSSYVGASEMLQRGAGVAQVESTYARLREEISDAHPVRAFLAPVIYGIGKELACAVHGNDPTPAPAGARGPVPDRLRQYA